MEPFLGAFMLAILIEGTITYLFGESSEEETLPALRYVALVLGIVAASAYRLDLLSALGLTAAYPLIGWIATGLIIGRGSNYVNDFISKVRSS